MLLERQADAERRQLEPVLGRVRAQLCRAERRAVLLEQPQAGVDCGACAAPVALRTTKQRLRMPGGDAQPHRAAAPRRRRVLQLATGNKEASLSQRQLAGDQPSVERRGRPPCGAEGSCRAARRGNGRRLVSTTPGRAQARVARERRPRRPLLADEGTARALRLVAGHREVVLEERRLGENEPRLREIGRELTVLELGHRLLGGAPRLSNQPGREQDLTAIGQPRGARDVLGAEVLVSAVEPLERRRDVAAATGGEAEVVVDTGAREREVELRVELLGANEIRLGRTPIAEEGTQDAAVVQQPRLPHLVPGAPQHRQRPAISLQRVVVSAETLEDQCALHLEPCRLGPARAHARRRHLPQCPAVVARESQREGETHPPFRGLELEVVLVGHRNRAAQMRERAADVPQLARSKTERALGGRDDRPVPVRLALGDGGGGQGDRAARVRARELDRVVRLAPRR